jgi:hypothetical protein
MVMEFEREFENILMKRPGKHNINGNQNQKS